MTSLEDSSATQEYDETVAEFSQDLLFLRSEWDRIKLKSDGVDECLMVIDRNLVMYEKRFDSMDHRFDQLTQILYRMETNRMSEKAQGKAITSSSNDKHLRYNHLRDLNLRYFLRGLSYLRLVRHARVFLRRLTCRCLMDPALLGGLHEWNVTFVLETFMGWNVCNWSRSVWKVMSLTGLMERWIMTHLLIGSSLRDVWLLG
ncbi:hypothetical protein Bca4012_051327 [Brassica carinata]|uniref:Uncharacterized protein n=1 Tax=Brassica carinata TaxID=52824 RepID=A0A8X7R6I4_BRACI|nr:hypothetical protein Bca52824_053936 [Brassica carinata]